MVFKGSIEDFLFILVGLIWVGFSIYKAQQKKRASQQNQAIPKKEKSILDQLVNEFITDETDEPYESIRPELKVAEPVKKAEKDYFSYDDYAEDGNYNPLSDSNRVIQTKVTKMENEIVNKQFRSNKKSKFDIRKAIIYSEILNRRYN